MSYLPVKDWWMKPLRRWGQCQDKDLWKQWKSGVRYYDFRIRIDCDGEARLGHGWLTYRSDRPERYVRDVLQWAQMDDASAYIRILLEDEATEEKTDAFRQWLEESGLAKSLMAATAYGVEYVIGQKRPFLLYFHSLNAGQTEGTFSPGFTEAAKHYDRWWHFALPPSRWLWEQERLVEALGQTGYTGIVAMDYA